MPEYDNRPFVNLAISIQDAVQANNKKYTSTEVMRYVRSASNGTKFVNLN